MHTIETILANRWKEYGLEEYRIIINGRKSIYKLIMRNNTPIAIVSVRYKLLPNELALKVADEVSYEVGARPFNEFRGKWFNAMDDHILYNRRQTQMHALYAFDEPVAIASDDTIQLGYSIHNSIDGSLGFGAGIFTFRHACKNMFMLGYKGYSMEFDDRVTLQYIYHKHTKGLMIAKQSIKQLLHLLIKNGVKIIKRYRDMTSSIAKEQAIKKIVAKLPKAIDRVMPYYSIKDEQLLEEVTEWQVFNDISGYIWHNNKASIETKIIQMRILEKELIKALA